MKKRHGWTGKIVHIDLTDRKVSFLDTDRYINRFIGGLGIGEKIYWDESSPETGAFHASNLLILMTGPLCATTAPSAPRLVVCGKSPATYPERFVNASSAGFFPAKLKKAGYDGIVLTGRADRPVYLSIDDGTVDIHDATHLWGFNNSATRQNIEGELGEAPEIMSIGPGCENGVRIGNLFTDLGSSASMGFGSVMGSKNLKAIAVKGSVEIPVAHPDRLRWVREKLKAMTGPGFHNIYGNTVPMPRTEVVKKLHCHGCPQGCWRSLQRRASGVKGIRKCHMGSFYAKWDVKLHGELTDATFLATELVNDYSLCTDELMFLLLWLEQCLERGILTEKQIELPVSRMGSVEFIEAMLKKISSREGFGAVLAEGAVRASEVMGPESHAIVMGFLTHSGRPARTYGPKSFIISAPVFAIEQRPAITTTT